MNSHSPIKREVFRALHSIAALCIAAQLACAAAPKISPDLNLHDADRDVEVIVQYKVTPTENHHQRVARLGGRLQARMNYIRAAHYAISTSALEQLSADPDVQYISPNRPLHQMMDIPAETVNAAAAAAAGYDGTGIGVAVIDSGMADIPDFHGKHSRIVYQATFIGGSPTDQWGHGTHVAGLIGSNGNGTIYTGIVPNVSLINLRALDKNGNGTDASVIGAIDAAISLKKRYNIRVINLSLGRPVFESASVDPLCQAVEKAWKAGIVVVVAAGNDGRNNSAGTDGYGTITAPGNDPYVITVGAMKDMHTSMRADDLIASYSSKGPTAIDHYVKPDILAPGNRVVSTMNAGIGLLKQYPQNQVMNDEYVLSGTSMATPIVSGAAVVLIQKDPSLTPDQVKARLMKTASKTFPSYSVALDPATHVAYTSHYDIFTVGAGYLDIAAALSNSDVAFGSALSPTAGYNPWTGQVTISTTDTSGTTTVWGSNALWGATTVWGSSVLSGASTVWGNTTVWGSSSILGNTTVWGSSTVWGNTAVWGSTALFGSSTTDTSESTAVAINGEN